MRCFTILIAALLSCHPALSQELADKGTSELAMQVLSEGITSLDPIAIMAWVEMERSTTVGETVILRITVENGRAQDVFELESIDLGGNFGKGFEFISVKPEPTETDTMFGDLTLDYPLVIEPGVQLDFEVALLAKNTGVFIGEVDIWEGDKFLSRVAQCKVVE